MSCERTKEALYLLIDSDEESNSTLASCREHLLVCPVCRQDYAVLRKTARDLSALNVPAVNPDLANSINRRIRIEAAVLASNKREASAGRRISSWVLPRVMPYSIGAFASVLLFAGMLSALRPHFRALNEAAAAIQLSNSRTARLAAAQDFLLYDITRPVTPAGLAADRAPFGEESPSLNPRGALAALTFSTGNGSPGDDDMVVVTNVFTDGRASVSDVVQAPRNKKMLDDFQDALRANAAFVPASYDQRPPTMRVVFYFQRVDVREGKF